MIVRTAAFVLGSLTSSFPLTEYTCLLIRSRPVLKSRSVHCRASSSPRRIPVVSSRRNSSYIPSTLAWIRKRRISSLVSIFISFSRRGGSLQPMAGLVRMSPSFTARSSAI